MPVILKAGEEYQQAPEGCHLARCYRVVDIGTQPDSGFGPKRKIIITWELPGCPIETSDGAKPMEVSAFFGYTLGAKGTLRKVLKAWRGRDFTKEELQEFHLGKIIGVPCQVSVFHNDEGKARVEGVMQIPKGMQVPPAFNAPVEYSITEGKNETYRKLPEFLRKYCDSCLEWTQPQAIETPVSDPTSPPPEDESDIPF